MTPNQFWYDEPRLLDSYIRKRELELDAINYNAWLFGVYSYKAVGTIMSNAFAKKGTKQENYFDKPIEEMNIAYHRKEKQKAKNFRDTKNYWSKLKTIKEGEKK